MTTFITNNRIVSTVALIIALMITAIAMLSQTPVICNSAHASDTSPSDFCVTIEIDITNNTGGTLTNYPVRAEITAVGLIDNSVLDPRGWDVVAGIGSISSEVSLLEQDLDSNNSPWWVTVPSIANGATETVILWMGSEEARRDQGIFFTGNEVVTVPHNALIGTGEVMVEVDLINYDATPREETIFSKTGYRAEFYDNAGTLGIMWIINDVLNDCTVNWNPAWTGELLVINFAHVAAVGAFTEISVNGTLLEICNPASGSAISASGDLTIGDGAAGPLTSAIIRDFRIRCCSLGTSDPGNRIRPSQRALHLTFNTNRMTENISSVLPYEGTIEDQGLNGLDATYLFNADQSNLIVTVNTPSLTSLTVGAVFSGDLVDVTGQILDDDIFTPPSKNTTSPIYTWIVAPLEPLFPQDWQGPTLFFITLGIVVGILFGNKTDYQWPAMTITIAGLIPGFAAFNGWVPWPFVLLWAVVVFFMWTGLIRMLKEAF